MPYKNFTPSELTSSDVNTYLMNQTVMTFDDASARASALTLPVEGMMTYLKDTNTLWIYDGSSWKQIATTNNSLPVGYYKITPTSVSGTGTSIASNGDVVVSSGSISFVVNGVFSSSFRSYRIHITDYEANSDAGLAIAFGTSFIGTDHNWVGASFSAGSAVNAIGTANTTNIDIGVVANSLYTAGCVVDIMNPFENRETNLVSMSNDSRGNFARYRSGHVRNTNSYTSFIVGTNTGANITSCRLAIIGCG